MEPIKSRKCQLSAKWAVQYGAFACTVRTAQFATFELLVPPHIHSRFAKPTYDILSYIHIYLEL